MGLSVGLVVGRIVILSSGLNVSLSVRLGVLLNVGPGVGLSVSLSLSWDMVGLRVMQTTEICPWVNLPVNPNVVTTATKVIAITTRKIF